MDIFNVELGYRHFDILLKHEGVVSKSSPDQGFYTSKNRFVSREEAFVIALEAGQIDGKSVRAYTKKLFSEDLYDEFEEDDTIIDVDKLF